MRSAVRRPRGRPTNHFWIALNLIWIALKTLILGYLQTMKTLKDCLQAMREVLEKLKHMLLNENTSLSHLRADYEEASKRLRENETALEETRRELELLRRNYNEQVAGLESEKLTLQELLSQSKGECHRINEIYAARQSALLLENEALQTKSAGLASRFRELEEVMLQCVRTLQKVKNEMDLLNKSNLTQNTPIYSTPLDRSIDVSYTEEQMLSALSSVHSDSRFEQDVASVATQVEVACAGCERRVAAAPASRGWRRYMWASVKSLFSLIAGVCLLSAVVILYNGSSYHYVSRRCARDSPAVPWRWLSVSDLLNDLFRIEYVGEVPM